VGHEMKKHALISLAAIIAVTFCAAWTRQKFSTNGTFSWVDVTYPNPTNHFDWMTKQYGIAEVGGPAYRDDPEWHYIDFGHNRVRWITFRRGTFGANWNEWEPTNTWFQSNFEPVIVKTNGVWLITFKDNWEP